MKIIKILMLSYLAYLIYSYFMMTTMTTTSIIVYIAFIFIVILGFKGFKIDDASQYMKNNLYENAYIKKNFDLKYIIFGIAILISPFVFRFIIKSNYAILASITYFIVVFFLYSKLKMISDAILLVGSWLDYAKSKPYANTAMIYENLKDKEKEDVFYMKNIISNALNSLKHMDDYRLISLGNSEFLFKADFLEELLSNIECIILKHNRISYKDAIKQINIIVSDLSLDEIESLAILSESINKYHFEDGEFYIHSKSLDIFVFCSSCGIGKYKHSINEEEYFCSAICLKTEKTCEKISDTLNPVFNNEDSFEEYAKKRGKILSNIPAIVTSIAGVGHSWAKNFQVLQNSNTGHGLAAEIMNHENEGIIKRFTGAAKLVGGDNAKNGADRLVDGVEIQTKYYKTATRSVNSAFDNKGSGNYRYYSKDGKPMPLEVPNDQYDKAIEIMEEKIKNGKIPGVSDPAKAREFVKKGSVTYNEAKNYSKFCTKESLKFDTRNGAIVASTAFGISFVINVATLYYGNKNLKQALKQSFILALGTGGKSFAIYMIGAQIQRLPIINNLLKQLINFNFNGVVGKQIGRGLASFAGKEAGKQGVKSAANSVIRGNVVAAAAAMAVTSSIDIAQMMRGRISSMQCVKNIAVNAAGIAGGTAGAMAGAVAGSVVPGIGTAIGALVGGLAGGLGASLFGKKALDKYIEDDNIKKQRIFYSHMINLSAMFKLSEREINQFGELVDNMISNENKFFDNKINVNNILPSSNAILKPIVVTIVSSREKLVPSIFENDELIAEIVEEDLEKSA